MKTYEESIRSVCLTKHGDTEYAEKIWDRQLRSKEIIQEVCTNRGTWILAQGLINNMNESNELGAEIVTLITNAIAQGVLIGMEMEKIDI